MWKQYSTPKQILIVKEMNRNTHTQCLITASSLLCNWGTPMTQPWKGLTPQSRTQPSSLAHSLRSGDRGRPPYSKQREFLKVCRHWYLSVRCFGCKTWTVNLQWFFLIFHQNGESETHQCRSDRRKPLACGAIDYESEWGCVVIGLLQGVASLFTFML